MALRVEEQITRLQISVEKVGRVHELKTFKYLVDNILFVNVFQDVGSNHGVQICVHEIEHQVDVPVILCPHHVLKADNIFVARQLLQEDNFSEGSLRICGVLKCIKILLECDDLLCALVDSLPNNTVRALTKFLQNLVFF